MAMTEPYAEVRQVGRFTYDVRLVDVLVVWDYGHTLGRHRAERRARRLLAKEKRRQQWEREAWRVAE